jgi:hypothetical protein
MFLLKPVEKNNQTGNCIMWLHLYPNFSCSKVVAYAFPWFIKFHGFMILTGTTKIGIQQITWSIHTIREKLRKLHLFHISYKFVNCIFYHFIITVCYIVHNTNLLLSTRIKYIPHVCHG